MLVVSPGLTFVKQLCNGLGWFCNWESLHLLEGITYVHVQVALKNKSNNVVVKKSHSEMF